MTAKPGWTTSVDERGNRHWHPPKDGSWVVSPDGRLRSLSPYVRWDVGLETVVLDGDFSAADLRAIASVMDGNK